MKPEPAQKTKIRYSDKELGEFKENVLKELEKANKNLNFLKETSIKGGVNGTHDTAPSFKGFPEEGHESFTIEEKSASILRQKKYIKDLKNALFFIGNKNYGICTITGKKIPKERLKVVPHATTSIEGEMIKEEKRQKFN